MGLVDAPDPQEAERGLEHCRMVQFLISLSQMVHYKYDQLLEVVELKYLNVCALGTPLMFMLMLLSPLTGHLKLESSNRADSADFLITQQQ